MVARCAATQRRERSAWEPVDITEVEQVKIWLDEHFSKRELPPEFDPDRKTH